MSGERRVDERVVAVKEIEHRPIVLDEIDEEPDRFLEHGARAVRCRMPGNVRDPRVVFFEPAEVEPVAGELGREIPDARVLQHAARLRASTSGRASRRGGVREQFVHPACSTRGSNSTGWRERSRDNGRRLAPA